MPTNVAESIRILIAEDNALLRGVLRDALAEAGMTVVAEASDGAEAVTLAEQSTPDVVVMDMRMPNVDGIVEGIETDGEPFAVGVLWHPEEHAELGGPLIRGLVDAAQPAAAV